MFAVFLVTSGLILFRIYRWNIMKDIIRKSQNLDIRQIPRYRDSKLLSKIWATEIGKCYMNVVENQQRVGYCSSATQRSILKSISSFNPQDLPQPKFGPASLGALASDLEKNSAGVLKCKAVYATEGYDEFLDAVKKANDVKYRISVNFLRSSLFGIPEPRWNPANVLSSFLGGHHSIVLGYIVEENSVAVYDVNDEYGLFLVQAERLFEAVNTFPVTAINGRSRGVVVCEVL
jgi:hypothetical protein